MTAARSEALVREYRELLRLHGVEHLVRREPTAEEDAELLRLIREGAARSAAAFGDRNLLERELLEAERRGGPGPVADMYGEIAAEIEAALADLGFDLPGPVHVGEYPHNSFNAQACRVRNGTLLLVNSGLGSLLFEVALAVGAGILIADLAEDGEMRLQQQTEAMRRRATDARETMARALAAYILRTEFSLANKQEIDATTRGALSHLLARSGEVFAVAHEYGHFLAGHLDRPRSSPANPEWLRKSHDQEFEADQIGALLSLQVHTRTSDGDSLLWANLAAAGPFLFLGIDHLLNRVRAEVREATDDLIVSDHPPSDVRAAALRALLADTADPNSLQLADSYVKALGWRQDQVIDQVRHLMRAR